jgi:DNA helicase-2/ATP-dependent DNA helicase PcrA
MGEENLFNEEQKIAVDHEDGPMLVLAGAGSGKTRVVTYRIANLLKKGVSPRQILAVTFTNKAAEEMRSRVQKLTNEKVLVTTFHSLGALILRESMNLIGFPTPFSIYDEKDSLDLLKSAVKTDEKGVLKSFRQAISEAKNNLLGPESFASDKAFQEAYQSYQDRLKENKAVDFDDLLFFCVQILKHKDSPYQERWKHVLVDEYQDTNQAQYQICRLLTNKSQNLFVVGDPDQSIYSWRGANIENILKFESDFPGAKVVSLMQNYRSTNTILKAANAVIAKNDRPYEKNLWSALGDGDKIHLHVLETDFDEARLVAREIKDYSKSIPLEDIAIFYRTNSQSRSLEDQLLMLKIPYTIVGGISFYQRKEVKDVMSFLKLIIIPEDSISFERTINLPKRGIGPKAINNLIELSKQYGKPILKVLEDHIHEFPPKQRAAFFEFLNIIQGAKNAMQAGLPVHEIIMKVIELSRYDIYLREDKESYEDRKANIEELVAKAYEWEKIVEIPTLEKFLEDLTLNVARDLEEMHQGGVRLMTLHNAKGLEFSLSFIVGLEENLFPHVNSKDTESGLQEERRLFYVGITRAKKHLHLSYTKRRFLWGGAQTMYPSRFLKEVPREYLSSSLTSSSYSFTAEKEVQGNNVAFEVGDIVRHKDFGRGVVLKSYETSFGLTYDIEFQSDRSKKSLVAKYAKLSHD